MTPTRLTLALTLALTTTLTHAAPQWTWEAGKQSSGGEIIIKSTNGSTTYSGTQNPTGAVAKTNQTAVTQPPTVIIQATSGGLPFNYKDDCWIFDLTGHVSEWFIGAGKIDTTTTTFTGIMGYAKGGRNANFVMSALTGAGHGGDTYSYWCGSAAACAWNNGTFNLGTVGTYTYVVGVAALPILTYTKCYP